MLTSLVSEAVLNLLRHSMILLFLERQSHANTRAELDALRDEFTDLQMVSSANALLLAQREDSIRPASIESLSKMFVNSHN